MKRSRRSVKKKSVAKRKSAPRAKRKMVSRGTHSRRSFKPGIFSIENILKEDQERKLGTGLQRDELTDKTDYGQLFQVFNLLRLKQLELTVHQLTVLSYIGHVTKLRPKEDITMMAISQDLDMAGHSTIQRVCLRLGDGFNWSSPDGAKTKKREGLGFIKLEPHPRDPRMKTVKLTNEGRLFLQQVEGLIKRNFATIN